MRLFAAHLARVLAGLCRHAVHRRRPGVLLLVLVGGTIVLATLLVQVVGPVAIYPFL